MHYLARSPRVKQSSHNHKNTVLVSNQPVLYLQGLFLLGHVESVLLGVDFKNNQTTKQLHNFVWTNRKQVKFCVYLPIRLNKTVFRVSITLKYLSDGSNMQREEVVQLPPSALETINKKVS